MTILLGILLTLIVFTGIVFIHEMGHFLTARFTKMKVEEFGIGIPPKAKTLGYDKGGTAYTLNWLPIGGFVRIKGEDPGSEDAEAGDSFSSKKWWARSLVLIAGVTMNFLLAIIIFFGFFLFNSSPIAPNVFSDKDYGSYFLPSFENAIRSGYIEHGGIEFSPLSGSIASIAGIERGDILKSVNGVFINDIEALRQSLSKGESVTLLLEKAGGIKEISITPKDGKIGSYLNYYKPTVNKEYNVSYPIFSALKMSIKETYALSRITLDVLGNTLKKLISPKTPTERKEATEMLSGPIGIGSGFVSIIEGGISWKILFSIIALLSINLGVLNILPFPALDGGRLVSTTIRSIIGLFYHKTHILNEIEYFVHAFGMIVLLGISLIIAFLDVSKFF